ncbi:protein aubergine-like isoform X2 [Scaptodrosophila lebanonensis]|uniref:Protein aubergine-like isoform X2 n=1 Tax=Drosophila lebanonensis TaxID=7225 RepID=A0A6J2TY99_DROLE|nr:protein aubergine-like isoform X2 [Scaptodrosophila lebanonensis]
MNNFPSTAGYSRGAGRGNKQRKERNQALTHTLGQGPQSGETIRCSDRQEKDSSGNSQGSSRSETVQACAPGPQRTEEMAGDSRGSVRGRRVITDVVLSRPSDVVTKSGTSGTQITVQTNYFKILKRPEWTIYQYRVDFSPDVDNTRLRRAYLNEHRSLLGGYIFDGSILFCVKQFECPQNSVYALELVTKNRADETIYIKIKAAGTVETADIQQFQVLNLILRRAMEGLKLELVSRNFFDPMAKITLENYRMEIWPGYQTSIRQHETDILLCTEVAHKVMRIDTLYHILSDCIRDYEDFRSAFRKEVVGMVVLTDYNNKTYRVDDVDYSASPLSVFSTKDGDISYDQYYKKRYNITIRDLKQPLVVSHPTDKNIRGGLDQLIMLIPELARATGMTDAMRADFRLMRAMSEHTRLTPERRIERLRVFNRRLLTSAQSVDVLKSWNIDLDKNLVEVPARVLMPERIHFGNQKQYLCDHRADWTGEFRNNAMFRHVNIKRWIVITPNRNLRETQHFVKLCIRAAAGMKMMISEPRYHEIQDDRNSSYSQAIDKAASMDPEIVMIVLKTSNEEKYACIKKRACVDRPVPSQVVTLRVIAPRQEKSGGLMSIATKVVIQMNAKLMGIPWLVELPLRGLMTVGFDVCHSSKNKSKSYGALVATMDIRTSGRFFSAVTEHMKGQELSDQMAMNMTLAIKSYRQNHGELPERIIFYRDGVGDGQLHQVVNIEVKLLQTKLDDIYKAAGKPEGCRLAFIVVTKRINTRYFVNKRNPAPGTIVDDIITLPDRYDFFLVSQSVSQGTVSPTNYNIIYNKIGLSADKLQMLTYKMTHMYYNFSGTCRVPSVCQYAHKLAFLVAESINRAPSSGLENQLYFL